MHFRATPLSFDTSMCTSNAFVSVCVPLKGHMCPRGGNYVKMLRFKMKENIKNSDSFLNAADLRACGIVSPYNEKDEINKNSTLVPDKLRTTNCHRGVSYL